VLLRPDTYIGSVEKQTASMWVHTPEAAPGAPPGTPAHRLEQRTIGYVPGLFKIFDEILVNAADNKVRDASMTCLRVDIDAAAGSVRVYNDGAGIPVEMHQVEKVYVPELIFGHLLTSSNYDDTEKKARALARACAGACVRAWARHHSCARIACGRARARVAACARCAARLRARPHARACPRAWASALPPCVKGPS
jgi:DNA gyrase/topoisomerase IV subunit B